MHLFLRCMNKGPKMHALLVMHQMNGEIYRQKIFNPSLLALKVNHLVALLALLSVSVSLHVIITVSNHMCGWFLGLFFPFCTILYFSFSTFYSFHTTCMVFLTSII